MNRRPLIRNNKKCIITTLRRRNHMKILLTSFFLSIITITIKLLKVNKLFITNSDLGLFFRNKIFSTLGL